MTKTDRLAAKIAATLDLPVDLTVRGPRSFTISTDDLTPDLGDRVAAFFGPFAEVRADHDEEVGSFAYVEVTAAVAAIAGGRA